MRKAILSFLLLFSVVVLSGCNIFGFSNPSDSSDDYVSEGLEHLWDGEYEEAIESFNKAIEEDPNNPEARWGRAKSISSRNRKHISKPYIIYFNH